MALDIFNNRVFVDDTPWKSVYVQDSITDEKYELVLDQNDNLTIITTTHQPNRYKMYDKYNGKIYIFVIQDGLLTTSTIELGLAIYNARLFLDEMPWEYIYVKDSFNSSVYEVILVDGKIGTKVSGNLPNDYTMFDAYSSMSYKFIVENGKLGIEITDSEFNVGDGCGNSSVKIGTKIFLNLNSNLSEQISRIVLSVVKDIDNSQETIINDFHENDSVYTTELVLSEIGSYTGIVNIRGYGTRIISLISIDKTIIDLNKRIPILTNNIIKQNTLLYI